MSAEGAYVLILSCDFGEKPREREHATFTAPTRMEAKALARQANWLLTKSGKAFCPKHADDRRASWR